MRLELSGSLIQPDPLVLKFLIDQNFTPADYIDLGYTHFEVICIGAGGGAGGGIDTNNTGTLIRSYGGAGGGGGFHRVRGLLSALPALCPIAIGQAGSPGANHASNPALTTDGGDGGYSSFNSITCRASGGKGGKRVQSNSTTVTTDADGGDGGVGNRTIAGGGAIGGIAGTPSDTGPGTPGTAGVDGTIFNNVGKGGGGGAGGVGTYADVTCNSATAGGRGSYNPGDTAVYGPGELPGDDLASGAPDIIPGAASGAKASPLNGLPTVYGRSGTPGTVVVRLTANVIVPGSNNVPIINTLFGEISLPITFTKAVSGQSDAPPVGNTDYGDGVYGADEYSAFNINGVFSLPIIFGESVQAKRKTFSQIAMPITFGKAVAGQGSTPTKLTPVAEISLASHGTPSERTSHSILIRARITSGSGGVIKAALYEGATNRSGDLTSSVLTTSLADYILPISDAAAATITSYSNLSIRIWGSNTGTGLVYEVARLRLELPTP